MRFGHFQIDIFSDGTFKIDGGAMFGVVPKVLWSKQKEADELNRVTMDMNCVLIRDADHVVLVETGAGSKLTEKQRGIYGIERPPQLLAELATRGVKPEDVTLVVNTHLHFDHSGGNTRRDGDALVATFPRASYVFQRLEWVDALNANERTRASYFPDDFAPLEAAGKLELIDEAVEILPGIRLDRVQGHTRGTQTVRVTMASGPRSSRRTSCPTAITCRSLDPGAGPLPARHARGEAHDPRAGRRGAVDRRLHPRPPALRHGDERGREVPLHGAGRLTVPDRASTLIIGGGIVGVATAFFLGERGETDVVVIEQASLGSGTTKGGLGGIRHQFVDELDVPLADRDGVLARLRLLHLGGHDFEQNGYLFIAESDEGMAALRQPMPLYERLGVEVELVGPQRIARLVPGIRTDDLKGGRLGARDGYGAPLDALAGFAAAAALEGVRFVEHVRALSLIVENGSVVGARTNDGDVRADRVLLATGAWTAPPRRRQTQDGR